MKRIVYLFVALLMMATADAQTLTERQKGLAACACLMAQGDMNRLEPTVRMALNKGVTINELKEAFSQLYAYTGFPRSLNALGVLSKVLENGRSSESHPSLLEDGRVVTDEGKANKQPEWQEGKPWKRPAEWDDAKKAYELGVKNQTQLSGKPFNYEFCPQDDYYLKSHLFGDIFAGDQLSPADRELVTVAALASLKGVEPQLAAHQRGAVNMGNSQETVDELMAFLRQQGLSQVDCAADAMAGSWPQGNPNDGYAQYFIGNSYLAPLQPANLAAGEGGVLPLTNVTFEPGCRNNWHIHHDAHQILICVSGRGWYQEWGKEPIELLPGMVIDIPAEVKHWHGAQHDSWFQHVTAHVTTGPNPTNEWLEAVDDQVYSKLK
jgi:alkylhydroperoxidase/carboxymuconolactone decarboxylase family protein YurZ/quercetin dioxygenase-like cupin family protein